MDINKIYTNRNSNTLPSWQVVYEWEDIFAQKLNLQLIDYSLKTYSSEFSNFKRKFADSYRLNEINSGIHKILDIKPKYKLVFLLTPPTEYNFLTNRTMIPVIIDFWKQTDIKRLNLIFRNTKLVLITSLEVFNYLKHNNCRFNIEHFPVSISDIYKPIQYPEKDIDIIQTGRQNSVINKYIEEFLFKYPDIEYVSQKKENGLFNYYSNKRGNMGSFTGRRDYMKLLSRCKISLLSSPGMDNGIIRTGGFNPVTPRFFESTVNYCFMLGRFEKNEDFEYFGISEICEPIEDNTSFEKKILNMLAGKFDKANIYNKFLGKHYTSRRVKKLNEIIENY